MEKKKHLKLSSRLLLLLCLMGLGLMVAAVASALTLLGGQNLLVLLTLQDVLAFILPAIVAMAIFYRKPLHVMCLDRAPGWPILLVIVLFYFISLPAMNWLINFNESMTLPSWMAGLEQIMRDAEDSAMETTKRLLDIHCLGEMLACVFVVGFMAGLSEEMLFRGAMLRTMQDSRLGNHAVVWIVAIIFSAIHLQFYGFLPRMVLGLWLGYLLVWSRSLWAPIIAHTLNNSSVVVFNYLSNVGVLPEGAGDRLGIPSAGGFPWLALVSFMASVCLAAGTCHYFSCKHSLIASSTETT